MQQIARLEILADGTLIALFSPQETYHYDTLKEKEKMSNQVYGYITDEIMEELERGCVPWQSCLKLTSVSLSEFPKQLVHNAHVVVKLPVATITVVGMLARKSKRV